MHPASFVHAPLRHLLARAALAALCSSAAGAMAQVAPAAPPASAPQDAAPAAPTAPAAQAETATPPLQRVEITGSAIKRIASETALPVQVIRREEIAKAGLTTAAEIMAKVSANANALTDGSSAGIGGYHDQMGFNSANLRGMGTSATLVLLNGRRMANFASPGDDSGVDLNNIPAAAIERVEVLLDGASAIYGTDAIAGVINFITRRDFDGAQIDVYGGNSTEGGGGKGQVTLAGGLGDVEEDGFNVFGVLDLQHTDSLNANQRRFISELDIPGRLPYLLSSAPYPGNIRLRSQQFKTLRDEGYQVNGETISTPVFNLSVPECNPPASLYLPDGIGGAGGCTYDYMRDIELYPRSDKVSLLGRGVLKLSDTQQLFAEASFTRSKTYYQGTANRIDTDIDVALVPGLADTSLALLEPGKRGREITVRTRLVEAGGRTSELTSTGQRYVLGTSGTATTPWGDWDYDLGLNHSVNRVGDRDVEGYLNETMIIDGFASGLLNPFGPSSPEGLALYEAAQINEEVRSARGTMDSIDGRVSGQLATLDGGPVMLALGAELRREAQSFHQSELLAADLILGDSSQGADQDTANSRKVAGAFAEVSLPITKQLEMQLAVRHDRYQTVGATTNPKVGLRFQPTPSLLLRASAGTGFRAPSLSDLYRPATGGTSATLADPLCMAQHNNDLSYCVDIFSTRVYSNPDLKPERSRQFSLGAVIEAAPGLTASLDYWNIRTTDLISTIGDEVILSNPDKYGHLIHRYSDPAGPPDSDFMIQCGEYLDPRDDEICYIELHKQNRGAQKASGLDITLDWRGPSTEWGRVSAHLAGTLTLSSKQQPGPGDPFISNLGKFVNDGVVQRWRHRASVDWEYGPFGATLGHSYLSGYTDQNNAFDDTVGTLVAPNRVKAYSLWDVSASWQAMPQLKLRAGVQNLFDTSPPFSNQAYFFISGYDPSYTDPRGRFVYASATYSF